LNRQFTSSHNIEMQVGKVETSDVDGGRPPKFLSQLPQAWLTANEEGIIDV